MFFVHKYYDSVTLFIKDKSKAIDWMICLVMYITEVLYLAGYIAIVFVDVYIDYWMG